MTDVQNGRARRLGLTAGLLLLVLPPAVGAHATTPALIFPTSSPALQPCPSGFPSADETAAWRARVNAARVMDDSIAKRDSMLTLVREALSGSDLEVRAARTSSPDQVVPEDYQPVPVLNFDIHLNNKQSVRFSADRPTRSLAGNGGYYFTWDQVPYIVLGPKIVDARGPIFIREYADHELYHARNDVGDPRSLTHRELEAWTHTFVNWFHKKYPYRTRWGPLLSYYEDSGEEEQTVALQRLTEYYDDPPVTTGCADDVRAAFRGWIGRRLDDERTASMKLLHDLRDWIQEQSSSDNYR